MQRALGILETYGLLCGVAVADTMVKAANVELIGYELSRGQGMTTVKIEGDVGAVKAALASGEAQAKEMGLFRGKDLIPRPAPNLDILVYNENTVGYEAEAKATAKPEAKATAKPTCNLCGDPQCPRKKGEPKKKCIHYKG